MGKKRVKNGSFVGDFGPFLGRSRVTLGSLRDHFGIVLASFWAHFGVVLVSSRPHFEPVLSPFLVILKSLCKPHRRHQDLVPGHYPTDHRHRPTVAAATPPHCRRHTVRFAWWAAGTFISAGGTIRGGRGQRDPDQKTFFCLKTLFIMS